MKKLVIFACIAISFSVIQTMDSLGTTKPAINKETKYCFKTVPDWSKTKSPKQLPYYDHLYKTK